MIFAVDYGLNVNSMVKVEFSPQCLGMRDFVCYPFSSEWYYIFSFCLAEEKADR